METNTTSLGVARAYQRAKTMQVADVPRPQLLDETPRPSFTDLLEQNARDTVQTIRAGEAAGIAGLKGQMPMQQVVEATMAMESALKTTVALRDKVVEAYQEIMRMSV